MSSKPCWEPPAVVTRDEACKINHQVMAMPIIEIENSEDLFRIDALEKQWNIGAVVYRPADSSKILTGPGVKPVLPFLSIHGIDDGTVPLQCCQRSLSLFAKLKPPPEIRSVSLGAGIHTWGYTEPELPLGIVPSVASLWHEAILKGFTSPRPLIEKSSLQGKRTM